MKIAIDKLDKNEGIPYELLLLADPSREQVEKYLQQGECFAGKINNNIIGAFILVERNAEIIELVNIAVTKKLQNQGIGKILLKAAINIAKEKGYQSLEVGTGNSSLNQIFFYQKCGFRMIGVDKDFFLRHYQEEIIENGIQCRDMLRLSIDLESLSEEHEVVS